MSLMLKKRIITSACAIPVFGAIVWFGEPYMTICTGIIGLLAVIEFYRLSNITKNKFLTGFGITWTLLLIASHNQTIRDFIDPHFSLDLLLPLLITSGIAVSLCILLACRRNKVGFSEWAWTFAGILYVGILFSHLVSLRGLDHGRAWLFLAIFATFGSDTSAYFVGKIFGKHKLAPHISPMKTWEGAIGGLLGAVIVSLFFLLPTPVQLSSYLTWWQAIILGILVSIFGQLGDLMESLLKRNTGVKDSGTLFPGHGGMLDRTDSIIFAVIAVYYWVLFFR